MVLLSKLISRPRATAADAAPDDECHAEHPELCPYHGIAALAKTDEADVGGRGWSDSEYLTALANRDFATALKQFRARVREAFGGTKVVDASGEPRAVYHGTRSTFTEFRHNGRVNSNGISDVGFWFTDTEDGARAWADSVWYGGEGGNESWRDDSKTNAMPLFIRVKNPKTYETTRNDGEIAELEKVRDALYAKLKEIGAKYWHDPAKWHTRSGVPEWDAFGESVEQNGVENEWTWRSVKEEKKAKLREDVKAYVDAKKEMDSAIKRIQTLRHSDSFEKLKLDIYALENKDVDDAFGPGDVGYGLADREATVGKFADMLKADGHDGIVISKTGYDAKFFGETNDQYVVFDPRNIKSAELVTKDDDGKVIPLSQRFDFTSADIRF